MRYILWLALLCAGCQTTGSEKHRPERAVEVWVDVPPTDPAKARVCAKVSVKF